MGESVGMPRQLRRNEQSCWITYGGWQPAIGALGDGGSRAMWAFGRAEAEQGVSASSHGQRVSWTNKVDVPWASGADFGTILVVDVVLGNKPISSRVKLASVLSRLR